MDANEARCLGVELAPRVDEGVNVYLLNWQSMSLTLPSEGIN